MTTLGSLRRFRPVMQHPTHRVGRVTDPLDADQTRRLALIRVLLSRAEEDSRQSRPFSSDSINRLHDITEMFPALAVERHHKQIPKEFTGYWPLPGSVLKRPLGYHAQAHRLNKARATLKHYGIEPSSEAIDSCRAAVRGLLLECSPLFGIELTNVSIADLLTSSEARDLLRAAGRHGDLGDAVNAFADLGQAFSTVLMDYEDRKLDNTRGRFG